MTRIRTRNGRAQRRRQAKRWGGDCLRPALQELVIVQLRPETIGALGDELTALFMQKAPLYYNDDGLRIITEAAAKFMADPRYADEIKDVQRQFDEFTKAIRPSVLAALDEGDACPGCGGRLAYIREGDCSCHIAPPCYACVEAPLKCETCGEHANEEGAR